MSIIGELRRYKEHTIGFSIWEDPDCTIWREASLMPTDVFVILENNDPVRQVIKVLKINGETGWVGKKAIERSEPLR